MRDAETKVVHRLIIGFCFSLLLLSVILHGNKFQLPAKYIRFPLFEEAQFVGGQKSLNQEVLFFWKKRKKGNLFFPIQYFLICFFR